MDRQMHRQVSRHKNRIETNKQTGRQAGRHAAGTIIEPSYGSFKHFVHLFFFYINTQKNSKISIWKSFYVSILLKSQ